MLIHPPEWAFEKKRKNIVAGLKQNKIQFPFILDKERNVINELGVNFWPTQILMSKGKVVYTHVGEGNYRDLEDQIIKILKIKKSDFKRIFTKEPEYSKYPTIYCGKRKKGKIIYEKEANNKLNFGIIYSDDGWKQEEEFLRSTADKQKLTILAKGKVVNFVAESLKKKPIIVSARLDNKNVKKLKITRPRLYKLLQLKENSQKLSLITGKNLAIYSFSFQ